uniref:SPIN90/Ldb17 leucine-rich domain-containing protein n=1 Tax=Coccidioides posadasii RMSCC 3488 TaxID=454284 RepID=A0A0J6F604_COCPO|nr:hypothetical protein CPAG_01057 [Coccidioides posadasii RMSCC 3488]
MGLGMELEVSHSLENEDQFWDELHRVVDAQCDSHAAIDNVLRAYLELTTRYKDDLLHFGHNLSRCSEILLTSELFSGNAEYIRRQIIYSLLQEDDPSALYVIVLLLLVDGRHDEIAFEMMNSEGAFVRLLELIQSRRRRTGDHEAGLHRLLMDLFYEMSRIQRIKIEDLLLVDDEFIKVLFSIIEEVSNDVDDPYHYPVIKVLLVLNEQFMVSTHDAPAEHPSLVPPTNKVIKVLSMYGGVYKTFGENIILLLNRENETSLQLLTLKLLYLLFTTPSTYEYFYTNDLRVLVDILIRNLLDLPEEASALRHTYLRVLYPLLTHTQLKNPPYYKRDELRRLFAILIRDQIAGYEDEYEKILHFDEVDETTKRLVLRCAQVDWLIEHEERLQVKGLPSVGICNEAQETHSEAKTVATADETLYPDRTCVATNLPKESSAETLSPVDRMQAQSPSTGLEPSRASSVSMAEIATQREKPGVMMPRKSAAVQTLPKKKPEPPKARGWRGRRGREEEEHKETNMSPGPTHLREKRSIIRRTASECQPTSHTITIDAPSPPSTSTTSEADLTIPVSKPRAHHSSLHPPAVPPPRRSSHSVPPPVACDVHHHSPIPPTPPHHHHNHSHPQTQVSSKTGLQKPEPPKTRRWRAHLHARLAVDERSRCGTPQSDGDDTSNFSRESSISNVSRPGEPDHAALDGIAEIEKTI